MRARRNADIWGRTRLRRGGFVVVLGVIVLVGGFFATDAIRRHVDSEADLHTNAEFYQVPSPLPPGEPGSLIRVEAIDSAPLGSTAWQIIYHSRDLAGADIPVSAVLVVPDSPAPEQGRAIVAWGHPTTGAAPKCAPSLGLDPFQLIEGMHELLLDGYAIVATDYPGLGVSGASSYLLGVPESNSILDSVRAARSIAAADVGDDFVLWGHSQGGQAALFAAERATEYAPELHLRAVAVAAPAADLSVLMSDDIVDVSGVTIAAYAIPAFEAAYAGRYPDGELSSILTPAGAAATADMAALCLLTQNAQLHAIAEPLIGDYVRSDPATTEPWSTVLAENSAGGHPITVPVFVGQGLADELVRPEATIEYVASLCDRGTNVSFRRYTDVDHGFAAYAALPDMLTWLSAVSEGRTPASTC